jgi:hypothetical protein
LILAEVLERGLEFFFDAAIDLVLKDAERAFLLVVDIVGILAAIVVAGGLRFILAGTEDDPAKRIEGSQWVHSSLIVSPFNESSRMRFLALTGWTRAPISRAASVRKWAFPTMSGAE